MKDYILLESRLDYSHQFKGDSEAMSCSSCGKIRALHAYTGFVPNKFPSRLGTDPKASYRGHLYWSRPGTLSYKKEGAGPYVDS